MKHSTQPFVDLIAATLGLRVREQEENALGHKLLKRAKSLGLPSLEAYYQLLVSTHTSVVKDAEWLKLIDVLTVNESYFLRDQGQFALLKHHVLPELIHAKQQLSCTQQKNMRVWSAGCSTGEEAYSLAILLKELIPAEQSWNILVLGTDINELALLQAKQGIYSNWSFRAVNPEIQNKYFRPHRQGWEVDPAIRDMVTFQLGNLVQDDYPNVQSKIHNFDLILCRNVFIYFNAAAIASVLNRFYWALSPNGYLMTGHTELYGQNLGQFQVKTFPESVIYQRQSLPQLVAPTQSPVNETPSLALPDSSLTRPADPSTVEAATIRSSPESEKLENRTVSPEAIALDHVTTLIRSKAYTRAIHAANQLIVQFPRCFQAYCLIAEAYANSGDYANAIRACQQAQQLNPFATEPIYLLAQISQEQGDLEEARNLLRRVIYLAPTSVYAYFELGCLYEQQGNLARACKNWQAASDALKQVMPETTVDFQDRLTAAELQIVVEQKLSLNKSRV
ncbi:tetratricopeptide repeat protein [Oscillatoria sp. FACHB-1407]|uniref:CheR family methyltransferase n=1 Tax=Oscillatoria sp. FACHB-1407 TaxID=2692847 RepID=UPI0016882CE9|nr:CheR family methyltransferase [Oscillatoria sp. FACHB-1407]MBD2459510.1 tetratricopeptide repeat protein [Oscillatoria sp. FACHB-1407]